MILRTGSFLDSQLPTSSPGSHLEDDDVYQDRSLEILAKVRSNFVMVIVNGSAYDFAPFKTLSAICSPNKMDQNVELRKWMPA
jgi:hypothetical protein